MSPREIIYSAIVCHSGHAQLTPDTSIIGLASLFPTQIQMIASSVYEMAQLSLNSVLVPVFTGIGRDAFRMLDIPKVRERLFGSLRIS
jgi:hypothetical protein